MKEAGFTLVELLVTITIVGILAAMAVGLYEEYRNKAYDVEVRLTMHHVLTAREGAEDVYTALSPGGNRNVTRHYNNGSSWTLSNVSSHEDMLPGIVAPPNHMSVYYGENHCTTSGCLEYYIRVTSCKSGRNTEKSVWANGNVVNNDFYNAPTDALC